MKLNKTITIFFLLILAIQTHAITINGNCNSNTVQCDLQMNTLELCNNENFIQEIQPTITGNTASWINILPEKTEIEPQECKTFEVYTIAPCYASPGNYKALINFNTSNQENPSIECNIELNQGHFVDLKIIPQENQIFQCEQAEYELRISNNTTVPNQQQEQVNISIEGLDPDSYRLETSQTIVPKNNPKNINLKIIPACTQEIGNYQFRAKASLFNPEFFSTTTGQLTISQGQNLETQFETSNQSIQGNGSPENPFIACTEKQTIIPLKIKNNGNKTDNLKIELQGPAWVKTNQSSIIIEKNQEKEINLILEKNNDELKKYNATLSFSSTIFNYSKTENIQISLEDCFNAVIELENPQENICKDEKTNLFFTLKNDKKNPLKLKIETSGITETTKQQEIEINAFEEKQLEIEINAKDIAIEGKAEKEAVAIELIFDSSASMNQKIEGLKKIDIAKNAALSLAKNITGTNFGLRIFGETNNCNNSRLALEIGPINIDEISNKLANLTATGQTPLSQTLIDSIEDFKRHSLSQKYLIIVSDGKESCNGNIDQAIKTLSDNKITVYAIGFDIDQTGKTQLQKIVQATNGKYFDTKNHSELLNAINEVTKKLNIELSKKTQQKLTIKLLNENFSIEKDFLLNFSDCHNISVFVPEINACRQINEKEKIIITNLGTKTQNLSLQAEPDFIKIEENSLSILPGTSIFVQTDIFPQKENSETELKITAISENTKTSTTAKINYLKEQQCTGFELIPFNSELVSQIGIGQRQKILLVNLGKTEMTINLQANQPWIYFEPEQVTLKEGQTGFSNFFITPPFDFNLLENQPTATITAKNNFGITVSKEAKLIVTGPSFGLIPENIEIQNITMKIPEQETDKRIEINFELLNNSQKRIEIQSLTTPSIDSSIKISQQILEKKQTTQITIFSDLPETQKNITIPLVITTTEGMTIKEIQLTNNNIEPQQEIIAQTPQENQPSIQTQSTGFYALATVENFAIIVLVFLVILLVAFIASKIKNNKPEPTQTDSNETEIKNKNKEENYKTQPEEKTKPKKRKKTQQK